MGIKLQSLRVILSLIGITPSAFGSSVAGVAPRDQVIAPLSAQAECGQHCLYQQAKENQIIDVLYNVEKVKKIEQTFKQWSEVRSSPTSSNAEVDALEAKIWGALGSFCLDSEGMSGCFSRYRNTVRNQLQQARANIIELQDRVSTMEANGRVQFIQGVSGQTVKEAQAKSEAERAAKTPAPYMPSWEELKARHHARAAEIDQMTVQEQIDWTRNQVVAPRAEFFAKTQEVADPIRRGQTTEVLDRSCPENPGKICYSKEQFESVRAERGSLNGVTDRDQVTAEYAKKTANIQLLMNWEAEHSISRDAYENAVGMVKDAVDTARGTGRTPAQAELTSKSAKAAQGTEEIQVEASAETLQKIISRVKF